MEEKHESIYEHLYHRQCPFVCVFYCMRISKHLLAKAISAENVTMQNSDYYPRCNRIMYHCTPGWRIFPTYCLDYEFLMIWSSKWEKREKSDINYNVKLGKTGSYMMLYVIMISTKRTQHEPSWIPNEYFDVYCVWLKAEATVKNK